MAPETNQITNREENITPVTPNVLPLKFKNLANGALKFISFSFIAAPPRQCTHGVQGTTSGLYHDIATPNATEER